MDKQGTAASMTRHHALVTEHAKKAAEEKTNPLLRPPVPPSEYATAKNPIVFLEFTVTGQQKPLGKVVIELFADTCPLSAENFRTLSVGTTSVTDGKGGRLGYEGTKVSEVRPHKFITAGDVMYGQGIGDTVFGRRYEDSSVYRNVAPGLVSLVKSAPHLPGWFSSEFVITATAVPELDAGGSLVVGRLLAGLDTVAALSNLDHAADGQPLTPVYVSASGAYGRGSRDNGVRSEVAERLRAQDKERRAEEEKAREDAGFGEEDEVVLALKKKRGVKRRRIEGVVRGSDEEDDLRKEKEAKKVVTRSRRRFF